MEKLKELALILNKHKLNNIKVVGLGGKTKGHSKLERLYQLLVEEGASTDEEVAQYLGYSCKSNGNYRTLKLRLQKQMLNTLFFLDPNDFDERNSAFHECYKNWAAVKILHLREGKNIAVDLSKKMLKLAIEHGFADVASDVCLYLRRYYAMRQANVKKFEYYNKLYHHYLEIKIAMDLASEYYCQLWSMIRLKKKNKSEISKKALYYHLQLKPHLEKFDNGSLHFYGWYMLLIHHLIVCKYKESADVCNKAIHLIESRKRKNNVALNVFLSNQMACHIQLKQYKEGKEVRKKLEEITQQGTFTWFSQRATFFMLSMHTKHYQDAYQIHFEAIKQKGFKYLPATEKEIWTIYGAYIHYLVSIGQIIPTESDKRFSKFKLNKFLNNVPSHSGDKRGYNVPVLIIHFLFLLHQGKYDAAFDRLEATEKYCTRYLKKDDIFRSNCFIKMLMQIPVSGFQKKGTISRAQKLVAKLAEVPLDFANQAYEVEIITYEDLWDFALASLDD